MARFDIRVELPDATLWDFAVNAEPLERGSAKVSAMHVAREEATTRIKHDLGEGAAARRLRRVDRD